MSNFHNYGNFLSIENDLTQSDIEAMLCISGIQRIQTEKPLKKISYQLLNEHYFKQNPNVGFRAFGFYGQENIDLAFCKYLTNIQIFWLDNYERDIALLNLEEISHLIHLKNLHFNGVKFDINSLIENTSENLETLSLYSEKSRIDIQKLLKFSNLTSLYLHGTIKNSSDMVGLKNLTSLNFQGVSLSSLDFINHLENLEQLSFCWGKIQDFSTLYNNSSIKKLALWRINHFSDEKLFSLLPNLEELNLTDLKHITSLDNLKNHKHLRMFNGNNLKSLTDFSALAFIESLESVVITDCPSSLRVSDILPILKNPNVKNCAIGTNSIKKNNQIKDLTADFGKLNNFYYKIET